MDGSYPAMEGKSAAMYDRSALVTAARKAGDLTPSDAARTLKVARNTAWRLWHGRTAPSARVAAAVESAYGLPASQLITPNVEAAA
ncbi:helix-turn-helix domain-containing protein [Streptomyces sp. NPDC056373]|uniref:helix-turn-helix domain-containing protein n=1 Tax=Streptomyces sp. NPDC056373 TaxID=3345798 RepID=UPI0035DA4C79